ARAVLVRPLERLGDPVVPAGSGAAERGDIRRRRVRRGLVDDVDELRVGVALAVQADPLLDLGLLVGLRQPANPARLLAAPDEVVLLEGDVGLLGVVVHRIEGGPAHLIAGSLDRAPLARVLRRELVPVVDEVRPDLTARVDVADVLLHGGRRAARPRRPRRARTPPPRRPRAPPAAPPPSSPRDPPRRPLPPRRPAVPPAPPRDPATPDVPELPEPPA